MDGASQVYYSSTVPEAQKMLDWALRRDPTVRFLLRALESHGCPVDPSFFHVRHCEEQAAGGFVPGQGIVVCANHVALQDEVSTVVAHELVHVYDHCRAKNLDWADLQHHACSEIRAANLSGQCHLNRELLLQGSRFQFREGHKACVKRKALLSVFSNPSSAGLAEGKESKGAWGASSYDPLTQTRKWEAARKAVEAVWGQCYKDTAPFSGVP